MPPAFNLSQDQTLQFNLLAIFIQPFYRQDDLTQSELIFLSLRLRVSYFFMS
jgi:hypothetical protein